MLIYVWAFLILKYNTMDSIREGRAWHSQKQKGRLWTGINGWIVGWHHWLAYMYMQVFVIAWFQILKKSGNY